MGGIVDKHVNISYLYLMMKRHDFYHANELLEIR